MILIDTHCHLDFSQFDSDREATIQRARDNTVGFMINVGVDLDSSVRACALAEQYEHLFATVGFHPHYAKDYTSTIAEQLRSLLSRTRVIAVGEIGLDYYRNLSEPAVQQSVFEQLITLGVTHRLPLVIHCRESEHDMYTLLKKQHVDFCRLVFHCFSGSESFLKSVLAEGAFVSFTASITYPNAHALRSLVRMVPLERMMLETDAPYLAPQRFRGKRNEPAYVSYVAQAVSEIKNCPMDDVVHITTKNANQFFSLGLGDIEP